MNVGAALLAGLIGGLAFLVVVWDAIVGGVFEPPFLRQLGTRIAPHASPRATYVIGAASHLGLSVAFGLAYAWALRALDVQAVADAAAAGLLIGLLHGIAATLVVGVAVTRVRHGGPGHTDVPLGAHRWTTTTVWIAAHGVFGLTVVAVYVAAAT